MSISVYKTFAAAEVLTASDLNASFTQITGNGTDVAFPLTKAVSAGGFVIGSVGAPATTNDALRYDGQIPFPATQNASSGANVLDDYEEGQITPALKFGGSATGITYNYQVGAYTKIGSLVVFQCGISLTSKGAQTGAATITLTGAPTSIAFLNYPVTIGSDMQAITYTGTPIASISSGSIIIAINYIIEAGSLTAIDNTNFDNASIISFSGSYIVTGHA